MGLASVVATGDRPPQLSGWVGLRHCPKYCPPRSRETGDRFFTSANAQRQFALDSGHLPSRAALYNDPDIVAQYPFFPDILTALQTQSVFRPQLPQYDQASQVLQAVLWQALIGERSPEAAMRSAAVATRDLLAGG